MKRKESILILFIVIFLPPVISMASSAFIQIKSDPGIKIIMDGNLIGVTNKSVGGLIIENVSSGVHEIKAIREGYQPQHFTITVSSGQVLPLKLKKFIPQVNISESGETTSQEMKIRTGDLLIQTVPVDSYITIEALGLKNVKKSKDKWTAEKVPEGDYNIIVTADDKRISHHATIRESKVTHLFFNILTGKVDDKSADLNTRGIVSANNLMWQKNDNGRRYNWYEAQSYCENLSLADYDDWRLPELYELRILQEQRGLNNFSIGKYTNQEKTITDSPVNSEIECTRGHFQYHWTATPFSSNYNEAWFVGCNNSVFTNISKKSDELYVRCVRSNR